MKSFASKIGMPRVFKRKVTEDFTLAPILIVRPSLVVTVSDVSPLSTLTHPSFGIPAIAATPSTSFSFSEVSYGTRESGRVVVVVVVGATVVVVVVVGATVVVVGATVVVVVGATVVVVVVVSATVVVVGATVVVVVVGATVVVVGATVVEVVEVVVVVGMVVSISRDSDGLVVESFPALSVTTAVTVHVPLVSVNKSQVDAMVES
jgi:hypothetical protein